MMPDQIFAGHGSSLSRNGAGGNSGLVSGWICYPAGCGHWVDGDDTPVCPMPEVIKSEESLRLGGRVREPGRLVEKHVKEIGHWRAQGWSWQDISNELAEQTGTTVSLYSLRNNFARMKSREGRRS
jgi:hypothetical protein